MARQPRTNAPSLDEHAPDNNPNLGASRDLGGGAVVTTLSNSPIESMPEQAGTVTDAAARALDDSYHRGNAKALQSSNQGPEPEYFRVMVDANIRGNAGFRSKLRAGKVISSHQYNIKELQAQGVRLTGATAADML